MVYRDQYSSLLLDAAADYREISLDLGKRTAVAIASPVIVSYFIGRKAYRSGKNIYSGFSRVFKKIGRLFHRKENLEEKVK